MGAASFWLRLRDDCGGGVVSIEVRIKRLHAIANSVTLTENESQDIRDAAKLMELAEAWAAQPTQRNVAALSSHIKALRLS